ncbi:MAG: hypothetical protein KAT00_11980 [Planctomycetes bacterium]|nr:hypothetical protein [Planctomycetota bacterium]
MSGRSSEEKQGKGKTRRTREKYMFNDTNGVDHLLALILGHALQGGAIRVGLTRDEGALAIGVYQGDNYGTEYVRPTEDLAQIVREIALDWEIELAHHDQEADCYKLA